MLRVLPAALVALGVSLPASTAAQVEPSCEPPTLETLRPALVESAAGLVIDDALSPTRSSRVAAIELDGAPPAEAVLAVDSLRPAIGSADEPRTAVLVLRCTPAGWSLIDRIDLAIDRAWDGTLDEVPGVVVLRGETLPGVGHDFARIEHLDVRGGHDPRFVSRRLLLLHVVGDDVVVALDTVLRSETMSGPAREPGPTTIRSVITRRTRRPSIRVRLSERSPSGRTRTLCRTTMTFDGREFSAADPGCL